MSVTAWLAVAVFAGAYVLIATEWVHRVAVALGGAVVMLLIGATDAEHAFFSEEAGIDWNVIFLLIGMMLIVAVLKRTGVFEYLAIWAAKRARGQPFRVMVILVLVTAVLAAMLDELGVRRVLKAFDEAHPEGVPAKPPTMSQLSQTGRQAARPATIGRSQDQHRGAAASMLAELDAARGERTRQDVLREAVQRWLRRGRGGDPCR